MKNCSTYLKSSNSPGSPIADTESRRATHSSSVVSIARNDRIARALSQNTRRPEIYDRNDTEKPRECCVPCTSPVCCVRVRVERTCMRACVRAYARLATADRCTSRAPRGIGNGKSIDSPVCACALRAYVHMSTCARVRVYLHLHRQRPRRAERHRGNVRSHKGGTSFLLESL